MKYIFGLILALVVCCTAEAAAQSPSDALRAAGVEGGLVVHLGCGDGRFTAGLRVGDSYLVHGLDTDAEQVALAREHIRLQGLYGQVSVDTFDGKRMPYVDNLVNLVVAEELGAVSMDEVMRVLAPLGVALVGGEKTVKPWPDEIDEWTHHFYDAGGNPVAKDSVVGPPRHLQWTAGPLWARSHEYTPSVTAMVSSGGRLFYICDETLRGIDSSVVPSKWFLSARDAFSGVLLWKRPVPDWGAEQFSGTSDITGNGVVGRFTMPRQASKRLVAVGDTVYVTLGSTAPVAALDAATGKEKRVYDDTANADEILCVDGRLIVTINPSEKPANVLSEEGAPPPPAPGKFVRAFDVESGKSLWEKGPFTAVRSTKTQDPFGRLDMVAGDGQVSFLTHTAIESLAIDSGKSLWKIDRPVVPRAAVRKMGFALTFQFLLTSMVYSNGVVLLAQPEPNAKGSYHSMPGSLYAFDARNGQQMWKRSYGGWGHQTQPDVYVVGEKVWAHVNADAEEGPPAWRGTFKPRDTGAIDYRIQALDLRSGKTVQELPTKDIFNVGHHNRCYRSKITERYLMPSRRGVEFVDLETGENFQNHWVRSGCLLGNLPCNGLLYVAPHPCKCYVEAKLVGFNALAASRVTDSASQIPDAKRLEKGEAFNRIENRERKNSSKADWPTYRGDPLRSGATESKVDADLMVAWQSDIGTQPSSPVISDGKLLVAGVKTHTLHALDANNGENIWQHTVGGRVDSPPTLHEGLAIFGSADGRVHALRASDGALAWRFDAAPQRHLMVAFNQLESPWPVPGSVLLQDGKCWFAAGRSSYVDGGIRLFALDPASGRVAFKKTIYSPDPETGKMQFEVDSAFMKGLLNDVPGSNGKDVFIRQMNVSSYNKTGKPHLYSTRGFLDASWFNRTVWAYGKANTSGIMSLGKDVAYGVELSTSRKRGGVITPGQKTYQLVCRSLKASPLTKQGRRTKGEPQLRWRQSVGIRITAMVRAGDTLFVAGSPDIVDPQDPHGAWEGRKGGVLAAFAAADGKKLAEYKLTSPPVWDGMAAAHGRLYLSLDDETVVCLRKAE